MIYTVAKPIASLLLLVVMIDIIGGAASRTARTFVVLGSALWATSSRGSRARLVGARRPRAVPDAQVPRT